MALGRLASSLSMSAAELMRWDAGTVECLIAAHAAFEGEQEDRRRMDQARAKAGAR